MKLWLEQNDENIEQDLATLRSLYEYYKNDLKYKDSMSEDWVNQMAQDVNRKQLIKKLKEMMNK